MPWPQSTDYNLAIQTPSLCFRDEELRACTAYSADPVLGLPTPRSGNFADVYRLDHPDGHSWAVKCFTREVGDLQERYAAISEHLQRARRSFIVEFRYLPDAMLVDGIWYPIVKMRWVEGKNLSEFVSEQAERPALLDKLALKWLKLAGELREAEIGHGDLQHGNVLLVPNPQRGTFFLRLIDYDGMYVPALANRPSRECGFPGYQHPLRGRRNLFGLEVDRFSHLVIFTALRAVRAGGAALWSRFGSPENLLFTERDFTAPTDSELLRTLFALPDPRLRHLLGHLILAALGEPEAVPLLETIVPGGHVRRLEVAQFERLRQVLGPVLGQRRTRVELRPSAQQTDGVPPLPASLQPRTRVEVPGLSRPHPEVPTARRLNEPASLPDWMLPEAVPLEETILTRLPAEDDSDPELPPLAVPPLVLVPMPPVEREPPPLPLFRPVLVEDTTDPVTVVEPLPEQFDPPLVEEPLDVVEALPEDSAPPAALPPPSRLPLPPEPVDEILDALPDDDGSGSRSAVFVLVLLGLGLLVLGGLSALVVALLKREPPGPPPPQPASLRPLPEIVLVGGQETVLRVEVDPGETGHRAFDVRLLDLPVTISAQVRPPEPLTQNEPLPPALFRLTAPPDITPGEVAAKIQLYQGANLVEEKPLRILLRRPDYPQLITPIARRRMEIGSPARLSFDIDRRGRGDRLQVELLELPTGVKQDRALSGRNETTLSVNLSIPNDPMLPSGTYRVRLLLHPDQPGVPPFEIHQEKVALEFARPRPVRQFLEVPREGMQIEAGGKAEMRVTILRQFYPGLLRLRARNLPPGVRTDEVEVIASNNAGVFLLRADATAPVTMNPEDVEIVALEGAEIIGRINTTVRVVPAAPPPVPMPLPLPMLPRPRGTGENTTLTTGDGVKLGATFYGRVRRPGEDAAPPCFLLLHDRGQSRKDALHQLLAESLQEAGFAVLTFDFRGHGDSTETLPGFEKHPGNALVAEKVAQRKSLDERDFSPEYLPVLLNDIQAARTFLDRKNDQQEIHGDQILMLGVGEGAALGLLWLGSETCRREGAMGKGPPESRSVLGGFWFNPKTQIPEARAERCLKLLAREIPAGHSIYRSKDSNETSWAGAGLREVLSNPRELDLAPLTGKDPERERFFASLATEARNITRANPALVRRRDTFNLAFAWVIPQPNEGTYPAKDGKKDTARPLPLVQLGLLAP